MGRLSLLSCLLILASVLLIACNEGEGSKSAEQSSGTASKDGGDSGDDVNGQVMSDPEPEALEETRDEERGDSHAEAELPAYRNEDGELLCPVMEVILESEDVAEGFQDYKGVRYWFSTAESADMFRDNPEKFAK